MVLDDTIDVQLGPPSTGRAGYLLGFRQRTWDLLSSVLETTTGCFGSSHLDLSATMDTIWNAVTSVHLAATAFEPSCFTQSPCLKACEALLPPPLSSPPAASATMPKTMASSSPAAATTASRIGNIRMCLVSGLAAGASSPSGLNWSKPL